MTNHGSAPPCPRKALPPTPTQLRVLAACALHGRDEAARRLGISPHSVKRNLYGLYQRLEVASMTEALAAVGWLHVPAEAA